MEQKYNSDVHHVMANQKCPNAGNLEMSCSMDKVASLGFSWKFNLHPLLVNYFA
jgi:hypothetical protein